MRRRPLHGLSIMAATAPLLVAGCTVGPDYARPDLATDVPVRFTAAPAAVDSALVAVPWWEAFADGRLNDLVDQAVERNLDLQRATAAVLEARATLGGARSDRWPTIDLAGSASRSQTNLASFGATGPAGNRPILRNSFDAQLTARYELDLWGRLARAEEAARARLLASEANRRTVLQTLIADVVRTWLEVRELQCQLGLALRTVASYRQTLDTVEQRYARGVAPALDVRLARQNLLSAEAAVPESRRRLREAIRRLEILAGRYPAAEVMAADEAAVRAALMPDPLPPVPAGLPSDLLARRPDLVAAEAGLQASVADVGAAKARLFPTLSLTGSAGYTSTEFETWFDEGHDVWSLVGNLVMPLVNRGATLAQVRAARARAEQAVAGYRLAVLGAFAEVENALDAEVFQSRRVDALERSVREARRSLELAESRYGSGLDPLLSTLEAQRRLLTAESQLLATQRAHRTARVNLILALGGPWDAAFAAPDLAAGHDHREGATP